MTQALMTHILPGNPNIEADGVHKFELFSEIKWNNQIFCASQCYKQGNAWYDWAMIQYQRNNIIQSDHHLCIAQCHHHLDTSNQQPTVDIRLSYIVEQTSKPYRQQCVAAVAA